MTRSGTTLFCYFFAYFVCVCIVPWKSSCLSLFAQKKILLYRVKAPFNIRLLNASGLVPFLFVFCRNQPKHTHVVCGSFMWSVLRLITINYFPVNGKSMKMIHTSLSSSFFGQTSRMNKHNESRCRYT